MYKSKPESRVTAVYGCIRVNATKSVQHVLTFIASAKFLWPKKKKLIITNSVCILFSNFYNVFAEICLLFADFRPYVRSRSDKVGGPSSQTMKYRNSRGHVL